MLCRLKKSPLDFCAERIPATLWEMDGALTAPEYVCFYKTLNDRKGTFIRGGGSLFENYFDCSCRFS